MPSDTTVALRGERSVPLKSTGHEKNHFTVVLTARANGMKMKPFVVFKGKGTRLRKELEQIPGIVVRFSSNGWMNDTLTIDYLSSIVGAVSFNKRLLVWDAYRCHTSAAVGAETVRLRLHTAIVPGGCTKFIQVADVVWNACFKSNLRSFYDSWHADPADHQYTQGGNLKHPSRALLCQWVKSSWEAVPTQMVKDSFITCAITTSTDGSDDNCIHCFKAGQPCATGKSRLEEETQKLHASGSTKSLTQDPFASDEDSDEVDNNEACIDKDDHYEEEGDDEEDDDEEDDDQEGDEEEGDVEEEEHLKDSERDCQEDRMDYQQEGKKDDHQEGRGEDHQEGRGEDHQEEKADNDADVGKLPLPKKRKHGNQAAKKLMRVQRQRMAAKDINKGNPIDAEKTQVHKPAERWIPELGLLKVDQECLSPLGWLTDSIMDAAQKLLQRAYVISGFQSVTSGLTMNFDVKAGEFVQILYTGIGHWVTVSTIGTVHPTVSIYDSLYSSAGTALLSQIAGILSTKEAEITLKFMDVPVQSGASDCGVYAIAFATALAQGKHPECYVFSQHKMRAHLRRCLISGKMEIFPYTEVHMCNAGKIRAMQAVPIYCLCRMPEQPGETMLACSSCKERFHGACETSPAATCKKWLCSKCT